MFPRVPTHLNSLRGEVPVSGLTVVLLTPVMVYQRVYGVTVDIDGPYKISDFCIPKRVT